MSPGDGARSPRHLLALYLGTTFVLLAALGWLGWQSLQQDRRIESQTLRDRIEGASDVIAAQIRQNLTDTEEQLSRLAVVPADALGPAASDFAKRLGEDALLAVFDTQQVVAYPAHRLLYYPTLPAAPEPTTERFAVGETYEHKDKDYRSAIAFFEQLARSSDVAVRAGALLRLARNQRKAGDNKAALMTYGEVANIAGAFFNGWPVDLQARKTRCDILEQLGDQAGLLAEAERLHAELHSGRWPLTQSRFAYLTSEVQRWLKGRPPSADYSVALALADKVDSLWDQWQRDPTALILQGSGVSSAGSVSLLSRATTERLVAVVSGPGFFEHHVIAPVRDLTERHGVGFALEDGHGQTLVSYKTTAATEPPVVRTPAETRLPWTLRVVSADPAADSARLSERRWLLIGGLGFLALLAIAGSYFSLRAMTREIQAARLQSEFVAAVSHEFRTPLTSLRQFTDLLADGRVSNEADRQKYYAVLQRGTRRLTRLVENLLDFGRMEAGFYRFMLEPVRAHDLVARVVSEFEEEVRQRGYQVDLTWSGPNPIINADEAALGRALWNLLDNAVKYSPDFKTIWVNARAVNGSVAISVRDRGIGIAVPEQRAIFGKFVRGSLPDGSTIKGTGLGLALVDQIVQAHGGRVTVESQPGEGSTFTILLPVQPMQASEQPSGEVVEARS